MIGTNELIDALVADARAVRRLPPPSRRAMAWLALPVLVFALLALAHGVRPDLAERLAEPRFVVGLAAMLLTGVLAAAAAFLLNLPDRSRRWMVLPLPALALWVVMVGQGCLTHWVAIGPEGVQLGESARCLATVLLTSLPLSLGFFAMLRRGSLLHGGALTLTASLAVAAMSAAAMSLFHRLDASVMVLVWNLGVAALIVASGGWLGRRWANGP